MRALPIAVTIVLGVVLLGLLVFPAGVRAHEQETSVDWEVAYANIRVSSAPIYAHYATQTLPLTGSGTPTTAVIGTQGYPTISLNTGEFLVVTWTFNYVATNAVRGDLFWITRLGLDFATIGRYITCTLPAPEPATADCTGTNTWIGSSSFHCRHRRSLPAVRLKRTRASPPYPCRRSSHRKAASPLHNCDSPGCRARGKSSRASPES